MNIYDTYIHFFQSCDVTSLFQLFKYYYYEYTDLRKNKNTFFLYTFIMTYIYFLYIEYYSIIYSVLAGKKKKIRHHLYYTPQQKKYS